MNHRFSPLTMLNIIFKFQFNLDTEEIHKKQLEAVASCANALKSFYYL